MLFMPFIVGRVASAARRPQRRPHAADLASDRSDHSDASAARAGRNAADSVLPLKERKFTLPRSMQVITERCLKLENAHLNY